MLKNLQVNAVYCFISQLRVGDQEMSDNTPLTITEVSQLVQAASALLTNIKIDCISEFMTYLREGKVLHYKDDLVLDSIRIRERVEKLTLTQIESFIIRGGLNKMPCYYTLLPSGAHPYYKLVPNPNWDTVLGLVCLLEDKLFEPEQQTLLHRINILQVTS